MDFKSVNWRGMQKYLEPKAAGDLNIFLEKLPQTVGQYALIAAGIAWTAAAATGLYAAVQTQSMIKLRADLKATQALKPPVPTLRDVPVPPKDIQEFAKTLEHTYPNLDIKQNGPNIQIMAKSTGYFGTWREAIGHVQNGGTGWRVSVDKMCVGRECNGPELGALLKINKVSVDKPSG